MAYRISTDAFQALESQAERDFVTKLKSVLRDAVPSLATESDRVFSAQVRILVEQARGFGLRSERTIGVFVLSAGLLGTGFAEEIPAARQVLDSSEGEERTAGLLENLTLAILHALER